MNTSTADNSKSRLIIVSNRLPVSISQDDSGNLTVREGSGGLVTAMAPVLRDRGGLWIGWPGPAEGDKARIKSLLEASTDDTGYRFEPVMLKKEEVDNYYYGFANEILWPLFHELQTRCNFDPAYWQVYRSVNRKFARVTADNIRDDDYVWIHDYHLMTAGKELRAMGIHSKIGYFLHTPFPAATLFFKLPWRKEIIESLLAYDLIGFQTHQDRENFIQCVQTLDRDIDVHGTGRVVTVKAEGRDISAGYFPISIDFDEFARKAATEAVRERAAEIRDNMNADHILLGVDRLDYTKGLPEKLSAFELALEKYPSLQGRMSLLQLVVPSRLSIPIYQELKEEVELKISEINGRFGMPGWTPVHFMFRSVGRTELLSLYRAADIAFITPLRDGVNLVAKEYCAANVAEDGVLVLSEFAGARDQLEAGAMIVNPYDLETVADTLYAAAHMETGERRQRMHTLRESIREEDIYQWVDAFMERVFVRKLAGFPKLRK